MISGKGVHMHEGLGVRLLILSRFFLKYPFIMKYFGLTEPKLS